MILAGATTSLLLNATALGPLKYCANSAYPAASEAGCEVQVIKNNISRRASDAAGYAELAQYFKGPKAVAFSNNDVVAPAKIIYEFSKDNDVVKIHAGVVEGKVENEKGIIGLATLPSRETLLTMLAMGMLQPLKDLAVGLNMLTEKEAN